MKVIDLLREKRDTLAGRWLDEVYATYPADTADFLKKKKDRFDNPVGFALRRDVDTLLSELLDEMNSETIYQALDGICRIRSVQEFSPAQAIGFVFLLKKIARGVLADELLSSPTRVAEMFDFESRIDRLAMCAFDTYMLCREQMYQARANEMKRSTAFLMKRLNRRESAPDGTGEAQA